MITISDRSYADNVDGNYYKLLSRLIDQCSYVVRYRNNSFWNMLNLIVFTIGLVVFIRWALKPEPAPINHIYSEKGKWYYLKFAAFYLIITFRQVFLIFFHNLGKLILTSISIISGKIDEPVTLVLIKRAKLAMESNPNTTLLLWNVLRLYQTIQRWNNRITPIWFVLLFFV